jgi:hypothetical protein
MKRSELNKNARRMILQEGLTHQGVFDELVQKSQIDKDKLAELISISKLNKFFKSALF